jgi:hypothetical protein
MSFELDYISLWIRAGMSNQKCPVFFVFLSKEGRFPVSDSLHGQLF